MEVTARIMLRITKQKNLTAKNRQEDSTNSGVMVHCSTVWPYLHNEGIHGRACRGKSYPHPHHEIQRQKFAMEHVQKPDMFWKQVPKTDVKM